MAQVLKRNGLKVWLCLHYSDTWADPGQQTVPAQWQALNYPLLKDSLSAYTAKVMRLIVPDIVQIGNEINSGFLHPFGRISDQPQQFKELLGLAIKEVRGIDSSCKIMLHNAGLSNAQWLYTELDSLDFDIIGFSYYPKWHGKNLDLIERNLIQLSQNFTQDIMLAETAYPFTLAWNDWTNNVVGWDEHLILPRYPASPNGQKDYLLRMRQIVFNNPKGAGFSYWGGEWVAFRGDTATDGSSFENQALFDFDHKALPVWEAFDLSNY
jgi:arabinogalactan endo-1,4-beta-galactosidase